MANDKMQSYLARREEIIVTNDQQTTPPYAPDIAIPDEVMTTMADDLSWLIRAYRPAAWSQFAMLHRQERRDRLNEIARIVLSGTTRLFDASFIEKSISKAVHERKARTPVELPDKA